MACPPGNCSAWAAFRLCKPLPPIVIDGSYTPEELQLLWFCWRARSTGEYGGSTPVDLGFDSPGLIDISQTTNIAKVIAYCESRGTLVRQFTNFSRFGFKFNLPNFQASGSFSTWSGGVFGGATSPGGGGGGSGGGGEDPVGSDPTGGGTSGGGGGGAATCPCVADNGSDLTVVVCTELDCDAAEPKVEITVCGGTPPYSWSTSGGEGSPTAVQSGTNNRNVVVTPADNPAPETAGVAYTHFTWYRIDDSLNKYSRRQRNCDRTPAEDCTNICHNGCSPCAATPDFFTCRNAPDPGAPLDSSSCGTDNAVVPEVNISTGPGDCDTGFLCDKRSDAMIAAGCLPCELSMDQLTITVTDDVGAQVATVISP